MGLGDSLKDLILGKKNWIRVVSLKLGNPEEKTCHFVCPNTYPVVEEPRFFYFYESVEIHNMDLPLNMIIAVDSQLNPDASDGTPLVDKCRMSMPDYYSNKEQIEGLEKFIISRRKKGLPVAFQARVEDISDSRIPCLVLDGCLRFQQMYLDYDTLLGILSETEGNFDFQHSYSGESLMKPFSGKLSFIDPRKILNYIVDGPGLQCAGPMNLLTEFSTMERAAHTVIKVKGYHVPQAEQNPLGYYDLSITIPTILIPENAFSRS